MLTGARTILLGKFNLIQSSYRTMNMILSAKLFHSLCRLLRLNPRARGSILPARFRE